MPPQRAAAFHTRPFGREIQPWPAPVDYWIVTTGPEDRPDGHCRRDVLDLDSIPARVPELGGEVVLPKPAVPGVGHNACCKNTEGSIFEVFQSEPLAKEYSVVKKHTSPEEPHTASSDGTWGIVRSDANTCHRRERSAPAFS